MVFLFHSLAGIVGIRKTWTSMQPKVVTSLIISRTKTQDPEVKLFLDQYQRLFSHAEKPVGVLHMIAALAYHATYMLLQSIMEAGTDDSSKVGKDS